MVQQLRHTSPTRTRGVPPASKLQWQARRLPHDEGGYFFAPPLAAAPAAGFAAPAAGFAAAAPPAAGAAAPSAPSSALAAFFFFLRASFITRTLGRPSTLSPSFQR